MERQQRGWVLAAIVLTAGCGTAREPRFAYPGGTLSDSATLARYMPRLAAEAMAAYQEPNRVMYLSNLFRLQAVAGQYAESKGTLGELAALPGRVKVPEIDAANTLYAVAAGAMSRTPDISIDAAVEEEFGATLRDLDDRAAAFVIRALGMTPQALTGAVDGVLRRLGGASAISVADALALVKAYHARQSLRTLFPLVRPLIAEDDHRRYVIDADVKVRMADGATICAEFVRPRRGAARLPALLNFTIYADSAAKLIEARRAASRGYAGVVGYTRGKLCSPDAPVAYEHDGSDAAALIDWIARQPWSDGRVGLFGGSYEGFTTWAATKRMPHALKAIAPLVPVAPGLDVPMEGNIVASFVYPWPFFTLDNKTLDSATYNQVSRWNRVYREWYVSGRPYRDLDRIDGTPNPVFDRWLDHPTYDAYWQQMIPYGDEFARIKIPVLQTAGYFFGGPGAAVYYMTEHVRRDPTAEHYLVIGPYDHVPGQRGVVNVIGDTTYTFAGYRLDPVALVDLQHLRYEWFDYVFKGAPRPAILKDKVNYQVMGANVWKHASSFAAMGERRERFYLTSERAGDAYRMNPRLVDSSATVRLTMNLADRSDVDRVPAGGGIQANAVDTVDVIQYKTEPLRERLELSGLFSGRLDVTTNKRDFDLFIGLYELTPRGEYILLATHQMRASQVSSTSQRRLLTPGRHERLEFSSIRLTSRQLEVGSRLVALLGPIKFSGMQINYGSGKAVSDESISDADEPLTLQLWGGSYLDFPLTRTPPRK